VRRLGGGGFGQVWEAAGPGGKRVALKFVPLGEDAARVEFNALAEVRDLNHPHLLSLFGFWQRSGFLILALELAEGTLHQRLAQAQQQGQTGVPLAELLGQMREAAEGLDFLNGKGIQHRDVKPHNLLLVGGCVKVGDLGLAKLLPQTAASASARFTAFYVSPEQLRGQIHAQTDQYALAVSYCQLRGGRLPFEGDAARVMTGHLQGQPDLTMLPEAERESVARALSKEPAQRWPSCGAFVEALAAAAPPGGGRPTPPARAPFPATAWAIAALSLTALAVIAALWALGPRWTERPDGSDRRAGDAPDRERGPAADARDRIAQKPRDEAKPRDVADPNDKDAARPRDDSRPREPPPTLAPLREGKEFVNGVGMKMIPIKPATFLMGSPPEERGRRDDEPRHEVRLTRPYHLAECTVTVGQFRQFVNETKHKTDAEKDRNYRTWKSPGWDQTDDYPVVCVSWNDAVAFCAWLSKKEGVEYRLPTEEEWEYACRAGTTSAYFFGDDESQLGDYAWYDGNAGERARPVARKKANPWGLYDMHGNVWQWCSEPDGYFRVLRGGCWDCRPRNCRAAIRIRYELASRGDNSGFRVAAAAPRTP
jgi:formylglycine-generating enzyme required for sulfatase activity